jgi:hypothetical protein
MLMIAEPPSIPVPTASPASLASSLTNINGDRILNGTVPGYPQYLEAAAAAQCVAGV